MLNHFDFGSHELVFYLSYAYTSFVINCFAYSSNGTPSFFAIVICDDVSLTVLRPVFELRVAEATFCVGLLVCFSTLPNLWGNSSFINIYFQKCVVEHQKCCLNITNTLLCLHNISRWPLRRILRKNFLCCVTFFLLFYVFLCFRLSSSFLFSFSFILLFLFLSSIYFLQDLCFLKFT